MPRAMPAGTAAEFRKRHRAAPLQLLDIQTVGGIVYYWSDFAGTYPSRIGGSSVIYSAYLKICGPFRLSRSMRTDGGEIVVQNLSGNSLDRDVLGQMRAGEFEGALAIFRLWDLELGAAMWEFHGCLTSQEIDEIEARFSLKQLLDASTVDVPFETYNANCSWLYKSPPCGSTGTAESCPHTIAACKDATRNRFIRFNGTPTVPAMTQQAPAVNRKHLLLWNDRRPWS